MESKQESSQTGKSTKKQSSAVSLGTWLSTAENRRQKRSFFEQESSREIELLHTHSTHRTRAENERTHPATAKLRAKTRGSSDSEEPQNDLQTGIKLGDWAPAHTQHTSYTSRKWANSSSDCKNRERKQESSDPEEPQKEKRGAQPEYKRDFFIQIQIRFTIEIQRSSSFLFYLIIKNENKILAH
jgi:hypothetical protein